MTHTSPDNRGSNHRWPSTGKDLHPALGDLANGMSDALAISPAEILELTNQVNSTLDKMAKLIRRMENCIDGTRLLHENDMPNADDISTHMKIAAASVRTIALDVRDVAEAVSVVSTQMLSRMGKSLQKTVAQLAVAQAESNGDTRVNGTTAE